MNITWNVYGKITNISRYPSGDGAVNGQDYKYDPNGNRVGKTLWYYADPDKLAKYIWYVRDAQGNIMAVYEADQNHDWQLGNLRLVEHDVYGSSRLGVIKRNQDMDSLKADPVSQSLIGSTWLYFQQRGNKEYELNSHLNNCFVVVSDKKIGHDGGSGSYDYYNADVINATSYAPFGMVEPGRSYSSVSGYRYGFNGKENDNEVKGDGNEQDYGMRIYDTRLSRFLSGDPLTKKFPELTPYQFASNTPIQAVDLDGKEAKVNTILALVNKDRTSIEIRSSISIKVQIINLSGVANSDLDLQNIALNLSTDLQDKLGGRQTTTWSLPFEFKSNKNNHVTGVETTNKPKDYSVTSNSSIATDVSVVDDISKIDKDAWVFAIVDDIKYQSSALGETAGLADRYGGKVAIGKADYFSRSRAYKEGRQVALHEISHLLGAKDTYPPNSALPGTQNSNNAMYFVSPDNKRQLTSEQVVKEIMNSTVGTIKYLFGPGTYKQPSNSSNTPTQDALKNFINNYGSATKINN